MAGELSIQLAVCLFRQLLVMFCKACNVASVPFACLEPKVRVLADLSSSFATSRPSYVGFNFFVMDAGHSAYPRGCNAQSTTTCR